MIDKTILAVDDDQDTLDLIKFAFVKTGATVHTALHGTTGLACFESTQPDLVLLDIMMPDQNGWDVFKQIRQRSEVPIIFLSALIEEDHVVQGFEYGAADYITKPFSPKILIARIKAVLRHSPSEDARSAVTYRDERLRIDLDNREILINGQPIKLTRKEFQLLAYLVHNRGQVVTFQQILSHIWGWEYQDSLDYVHVYMARLRQKLEEDSRSPNYLLTEYGLGYRFDGIGPDLKNLHHNRRTLKCRTNEF